MKRILFILLLGFVLSACNYEEQTQNGLSVKDKISITEAEFHPAGGELHFTITAENEWRVLDYTTGKFTKWPWLKINRTSGGKGTTKVMLTAQEAESDTGNNARIRFNIDGEECSILFKQEKPFLDVEVIDDIPEKQFKWYNGTDVVDDRFKVRISSNTDWKITEPLSATTPSNETFGGWLSCTKVESDSEASNNVEVEFMPSGYNGTGKERSASFTIRGLGDVETYSFTQPGLRFMVEDGPQCEDITIQSSAIPACNIPYFTMKVNSEVGWSIADENDNPIDAVDGLTIVPQLGNGSSDPQLVIISFDTNPDRNPRTRKFKVKAELGQYKNVEGVSLGEFSFTQKAYDLKFSDASPKELKLENNDLGNKDFKLNSSGKWEIDQNSIPEWLEVSPTSGKGVEYDDPKDLNISVQAKYRNYNTTDNEGKITINSKEDGNDLTLDLPFKQDKYILTSNLNDDKRNLLCTDDPNTPRTMKISSSGEWRLDVESGNDWFKFEKTSGADGDTDVVFYAKSENTEKEDRVADCNLVSVTHEKDAQSPLVIPLQFIQRKYVFETSPTPKTSGPDFSYKAVDDSKNVIKVTSSAGWKFESVALGDWIHAVDGSGNAITETSGDKSINIVVDTNTTSQERENYFLIKSTFSENDMYKYVVHQDGYEFDVTEPALATLPAVGAPAQKMQVKCSGRWRIVDADDTAKAMIKNYNDYTSAQSGDKTISLTISDNPTKALRTGTFKIQSVDNPLFSQSIKYQQAALVFKVEQMSVSTLNFQPVNTSSVEFKIDISENAKWSVSATKDADLSWLGLSKTSGTGSSTITIIPTTYVQLDAKRQTAMTVKCEVGGHTETFDISQSAFKFDTKAETVEFDASLDEEEESFKISESSDEWSVEITGKPSWLSVDPLKGTGGNKKIKVTAQPYIKTNENSSAADTRTAEIVVSSKYVNQNSALKKVVTVKQEAFKFVVDQTKVELKNAGEKKDVNVSCSGMWEATVTSSTPNGWLTLTSGYGSSDGSFKIEAKENKDKTQRTATVQVKSGDLTVNVEVTQPAAAE